MTPKAKKFYKHPKMTEFPNLGLWVWVETKNPKKAMGKTEITGLIYCWVYTAAEKKRLNQTKYIFKMCHDKIGFTLGKQLIIIRK